MALVSPFFKILWRVIPNYACIQIGPNLEGLMEDWKATQTADQFAKLVFDDGTKWPKDEKIIVDILLQTDFESPETIMFAEDHTDLGLIFHGDFSADDGADTQALIKLLSEFLPQIREKRGDDLPLCVLGSPTAPSLLAYPMTNVYYLGEGKTSYRCIKIPAGF